LSAVSAAVSPMVWAVSVMGFSLVRGPVRPGVLER
jgi:hypothetical protein